MNAKDRAKADKLLSQMEEIQCELQEMADAEREKFDNMSDGLQSSDRGQAIEQAADELEQAANAAQEVIDAISNAIA